MNSRAVILMYDVTDQTTLNRLQSWYEDAKQYCPKDQSGSLAKYFLVGNKIDCSSSEVEVKKDSALGFANRFKIPHEQVFRISVKTGKGLDKCLNDIASILSETKLSVAPKNTVFLSDDDDKDDSKCGC